MKVPLLQQQLEEIPLQENMIKYDVAISPLSPKEVDNNDENCSSSSFTASVSVRSNCSSCYLSGAMDDCILHHDDHDHTDTTLTPAFSSCIDNHSTTEATNGISIANLLQVLNDHEAMYGSASLEVAMAYNAIGLFHCRINDDCSTAILYHLKALRIIENLVQQQQRNEGNETPSRRFIPILVSTYIDIGMCYELQQCCVKAAQYYERADDWIIRQEQQRQQPRSDETIRSNDQATTSTIPKHVTFACRRAIARVKRL